MFIDILQLTFMFATPIVIAALGGLFSERSGVVNIGLEGIMLVGAFMASISHTILFPNSPWIAILFASIAGIIFSLLHAVASINFKSNQVISGTAVNILALGLTIYLSQIIFGQTRSYTFQSSFARIDLPILGKTVPTIFIALALVIITHIVLKYTKFGLRLRSCGEYPQASESAGINVYLYRYIGVLLSGLLAGLAGGIMVLTQDSQFHAASIHGFGFIALAALIFGKWDARGVLLTSLFFGLSTVTTIYASSIKVIASWPTEIFLMLPYISTVIAIIITSKNSVGPKAAGEVYDRGKR